MSEAPKFIDGLFIVDTSNAPEFIKGKLSINVAKFVAYVQANQNEKGYVNIDILESRDSGRLYAKLNDWKPNGEQQRSEPKPFNPTPEPIDDDMPF